MKGDHFWDRDRLWLRDHNSSMLGFAWGMMPSGFRQEEARPTQGRGILFGSKGPEINNIIFGLSERLGAKKEEQDSSRARGPADMEDAAIQCFS